MTSKDPKQTIYLDVDEEITSIIQKVQGSQKSIVALVLPKRATVFQSIVNMKLLKRTADQYKKKVVLITSERGLLPLAGVAGLHVAPTLSSKPILPPPPSSATSRLDRDEAEEEVELDQSAPVGAYMAEDDDESIELDNEKFAPAAGGAGGAAAAGKAGKAGKGAKGGHGGKLKVPNFNKFRKVLVFGGLALVLLMVGVWWALAVAPKASVTLRTEATSTLADLNFTADTGAGELNVEGKVIPALRETFKKTETEKVPATGEKDNGQKATGTVKFYLCNKDDTLTGTNRTVQAGTGISSGNLTFIVNETVSVQPSNFSSGGSCQKNRPSQSVKVTAQKSGTQYNLSPQDYSVATNASISAEGSAMTGGTSEIIKVVSGNDVETAKTKLVEKQAAVADELRQMLNSKGYAAIVASFSIGESQYTVTPAVDSEATEVTVQAITEYTMLGVNEEDLKQLIADAIKDQVDTEKQSILDEGLGDAEFTVNTDKTAAKVPVKLQTEVVVGPELNQEQLKQQIAGKKKNEAQTLLKAHPGVTDVQIATSPFWNAKIPGKATKITLVVEQADGTRVESNSGSQP